MQNQYSPKFPRTVAGDAWRAPLNHPELEAIAKRADHLYRNFSLSEDHRAWMLVQYARLTEADKLIDGLGMVIGAISLRNDPGVRPSKPIKGGKGGETLDMAVGFTLRLAEWVQRLEDAYGVTAWRLFGQVHDRDDDTGEFIPEPGEDF